jgi:hypothetical protein
LTQNLRGYADTKFKRMVDFLVTRIRIEYAKPEEKIVQQDDGPQERKYGDGESLQGYFMCVILKGSFLAQTSNSRKGAQQTI